MLADDAPNILTIAFTFALVGFSFRCGWMVASWMVTGEWK